MKTETGSDLNLIASGSVFEGKLKTPGSIRVDGKVIGDIVATQNISVGTSGEVEGNLTAATVTVGGKLKGSVVAQDKLVLEAKCQVRGDIRAGRLVVDEGAQFDGKCAMSAEAKPMPNLVELKPEAKRM